MRYIQSIIVTATSQSQVESAPDGARELLFHVEAIAVIVMLWISFQWYSQGNSRPNQSKRIGDKGVLAQLRDLSALLALIIALMHAAVPTWMRWSEFYVPSAVRWTAFAASSAGLLIFTWAAHALLQASSEHSLRARKASAPVAVGPYAHVRHPMYAGAATTLCFVAIVAANWLLLLISAAFVVVLRAIVIPREEMRLVAEFGSSYEAYALSTPRLIPRWRKDRATERSRRNCE